MVLLLCFFQSFLAFGQVTFELIVLSLHSIILDLRFLELSFALCHLLLELKQGVFELLDSIICI